MTWKRFPHFRPFVRSIDHKALLWRHNGSGSVANHQPHNCLLNLLFRRRSKKTSKLRVTGLCVGNSPEAGEFPAQMTSYARNVSTWWRHHGNNERRHDTIGISTRISNYIHIKQWYIITHPCSTFYGDLVKPSLPLGHVCFVTTHVRQWVWLFMHTLI